MSAESALHPPSLSPATNVGLPYQPRPIIHTILVLTIPTGGEAGHMARECPQNAGGPAGSGSGAGWGSGGGGGGGYGGQSRECYRCGGTGHIARYG